MRASASSDFALSRVGDMKTKLGWSCDPADWKPVKSNAAIAISVPIHGLKSRSTLRPQSCPESCFCNSSSRWRKAGSLSKIACSLAKPASCAKFGLTTAKTGAFTGTYAIAADSVLSPASCLSCAMALSDTVSTTIMPATHRHTNSPRQLPPSIHHLRLPARSKDDELIEFPFRNTSFCDGYRSAPAKPRGRRHPIECSTHEYDGQEG